MPIPQDLELLSQHLNILLGSEYQALSAIFHALQTEDKHLALEKDEHRAHLATLSGLIRPDDPPFISESVMAVVRECLPSYHFKYESTRETSIRLAVEKVVTAIVTVSNSHWSQRDLALKELIAIQQGYEIILSAGVEQIQTRVAVAILEVGYFSLDVATARRLLCIYADGTEHRENGSGAHAVCSANGGHYKPDPIVVIGDVGRSIALIDPGKEYAASSLIQLPAGNQLTATPTGLLSIEAVPLDRADGDRTTGGIVQVGLSIEGMCFEEFISLLEALRFFKRIIGEAALIPILEDAKLGYRGLLAQAKEQFPEIFVKTPVFSDYRLCLLSELETDLQEGNEKTQNKIYLSEASCEYAFYTVDGILHRGVVPPYINLSNLSSKIEETDFKKSVVALLIEKEYAARAISLRQSFERICEKVAIEECFAEIQRAQIPALPESTRALIFREIYEKCVDNNNLNLLQVLLALTLTYPELMAGHETLSSVALLKPLPSLFKLFPRLNAAQAIVEIERVLTDYLDKKATSALWVGLLLSLPQDAKLDNFRLQLIYDKEGNLQQCRIVSIDNDMSLGMPFMHVIKKKSDTPKLGLTIKNSLYWLPELLTQSIDPKVCARLLASSARSQWLTWLCLVARRNQEYVAWQQQGVLSSK